MTDRLKEIRAEGDGAEIVRELRAPEEGWSGNAECVSAEVAARAALEAAFPAAPTSEWNAAIEAAAKVAKKYISTFDELADAKDDAHKFLAIRVTTMVAETIATEIRALSRPTS